MKKNMFSNVFDKMVANFVPQQDDEARISIQGNIVVNTNTPNGKEWVDKDSNIYPEEMLTDLPVFTIAKAINDVKEGDIVKLTKNTFATVVEVKDGKVETISFGGQHRQAKAFKDMFLGQATVRVVVNLLNNTNNNNMNMVMMLSMLDKDGDARNDMMKTMMLSSMMAGAGQNPFSNMFNNPLALSYLMKGDNDSIQTMLMMQAMQGGMFNMFNNNVEKKD